MALTPGQKQAVECTGKPLFIQAGAGTGKTFTLTKRLAHGIATGSIPDVDNLLTITFTNKAAGELLGRVRAELRAQGLAEAALKVDAAWISTIHAMCNRILMAHAFEVGIDPGSKQLDDMETQGLRARALDDVLAYLADDAMLALLVDSLGGADRLAAQVNKVLDLFSGVADGADSFDLGPAPRCDAGKAFAAVHAAYAEAHAALDEAGFPASSTSAAQVFERVCANEQKLAALIDSDGTVSSWTQAYDMLGELEPLKSGRLKKQPFRDILDDCEERVASCCADLLAASAYEQCAALLHVANAVHARHRQLKASVGAIDMGDILVETQRLLERDLDVAREYRERFASVMVDEFQDTDRLQVAIVKHLVDDGMTTLATVGDAQQSIYGFRGADLAVYREMRDAMQRHGAAMVALDTNFRSHSGILAFVEAVFSKPEYFGGEFLRVVPGPSNDRDLPWIGAIGPRVHLELIAGGKDPKSGKAPSIDELRLTEAECIAQHFESLHAAGAAYGDMAVLLRSMGHASLYCDALRRRGIPCVISGGSLFFNSPEVRAVVMFLRFIENADDDEALFQLLTSGMFELSDDALLALAQARAGEVHIAAGGIKKKASLFDALRHLAGREGCGRPVQRAHEVLKDALEQAVSQPFAAVVDHAVDASGWRASLRTQGVAGAAVQANLQRICDLIGDYEARFGHSAFKVGEHFKEMCRLADEGAINGGKPATLASAGSVAVQIMTFHASKGLEFPIVAVAEYDGPPRSIAGFRLMSEDGQSYFAALPSKSAVGAAPLYDPEAGDRPFTQATDAGDFLAHACNLAAAAEAEEAQRLLYVALTRAKDLLIVMGHDKKFADAGELSKGQFASMVNAAFDGQLPKNGDAVRTSTGALVRFDVVPVATTAVADDAADDAADAPRNVHCLGASRAPQLSARLMRPAELHSYSSIAAASELSQARQLERQQIRVHAPADDETVSPVGSAFHLVAQWLVEQGDIDASALAARVSAAARRYDLGPSDGDRLDAAVTSWCSCDLFTQLRSHARRFAEQAFCVDVNGLPLEGFIDALCLSDDGRSALVIDYKTGTSGEGEELVNRYLLQASCYAYAVLVSGADEVELVFVRPEVGMQEVRYSFTSQHKDALAQAILEGHGLAL